MSLRGHNSTAGRTRYRASVKPFIADLCATDFLLVLSSDDLFNRGLADALAGDRHFEQAGFRALLA